MHRLFQHTVLYMTYFQAMGLALGELLEQGLKATNWDNKHDTTNHSRHQSREQSIIDVFHKAWWTADYHVMQHYE